MQSLDLHYTAHYNWAWVVDAALVALKEKTDSENTLNLTSCPRFRDLPSTIASTKKERATYSLFRIDLAPAESQQRDNLDLISKVRTRSDIFGFLDPKDSLARVCQLLDAKECMPDTLLIPWDWLSESTESKNVDQEGLLRQGIVHMLSAGPKLLKAPLGSGGFGLYFVYSVYDVEEIVRCHRIKAEEKDGFMEDLRATFYGFKSTSVLAWSLQDVISGVRVVPPGTGSAGVGADGVVGRSRRCQVRAYIVMVNDQLYLYKGYEVRLPSWDIELDEVLKAEHVLYGDTARAAVSTSSSDTHQTTSHTPAWSSELENDYCGRGRGRPYNEQRNKGCTERYVLSELSEIADAGRCIEECMRRMFTALQPVVVSRQRRGESGVSSVDCAGSARVSKDIGHVFDWDEIVRTQHATEPARQGGEGSVLSEVAIVGVDLVLQHTAPVTGTDSASADTSGFSARIVEINNNPAMPAAEGKHMSAQYKQHLIDFVASTVQLAVYTNNNRLHRTGMETQLLALKFDKIQEI